MIDCRKVTLCDCNQPGCDVCKWEKRLVASSRDKNKTEFDHLDHIDKDGNIVPSPRGAGNLGDGHTPAQLQARRRAERAEELERRQALLANHHFATPRDRRVYSRFARGESMRDIAKTLQARPKCHDTVKRIIHRIENEYRQMKANPLTPEQLATLASECDPTTLILFFALLKRALEEPDEVRQLLAVADQNPALRQYIDPEPDHE